MGGTGGSEVSVDSTTPYGQRGEFGLFLGMDIASYGSAGGGLMLGSSLR